MPVMKFITSFILTIATFSVSAQSDYNKWSLGANLGIHDGMAPSVGTTRAFQIHHFGGEVRYMINNRVGVMGDVGYEFFDFYNKGYNTNYVRVSLQGVVNAGDLLRFHTFSKRLGLLVHGGFGFSTMWQNSEKHKMMKENNLYKDRGFKGADEMINFTFGIRPQIKLTERWSLMADLSFIFHANQSKDFGMQKVNKKGSIDGYFSTLAIGANYYIGKKKRHADWTPTVFEAADNSALLSRISALEEALKDDDQDGVPNGRDAEANTPANSYVNSKGEAIVEREVVDLDKDDDGFLDTVDECPEVFGKINGCPDRDNDGIPDHLDECPDEFGSRELNGCALTKVELEEIKVASEAIFFNTGKSEIKSESFSSLNKMADILNNNPQVKVMVEGHTDNTGNEDYNLNLSKERAAAVVDYLSSKGVNRARMQSEGFGQTRPIASNDTEEGRAQNRRVKIATSLGEEK